MKKTWCLLFSAFVFQHNNVSLRITCVRLAIVTFWYILSNPFCIFLWVYKCKITSSFRYQVSSALKFWISAATDSQRYLVVSDVLHEREKVGRLSRIEGIFSMISVFLLQKQFLAFNIIIDVLIDFLSVFFCIYYMRWCFQDIYSVIKYMFSIMPIWNLSYLFHQYSIRKTAYTKCATKRHFVLHGSWEEDWRSSWRTSYYGLDGTGAGTRHHHHQCSGGPQCLAKVLKVPPKWYDMFSPPCFLGGNMCRRFGVLQRFHYLFHLNFRKSRHTIDRWYILNSTSTSSTYVLVCTWICWTVL